MSETLSFDCPACGVRLRVSALAAGVTAPCPRCGQIISAPQPEPEIQPVLPAAPSAAVDRAAPSETPTEPEANRPASPLLACILTGLISLAIGYGIGRFPHKMPSSAGPSTVSAPVVPDPPANGTVPESPPPAIAAAEAALRNFLAAPNHTGRLKYCLFPEAVAPRAASWQEEHAGGPVEVFSVRAGHTETDPGTGRLLVVFQVATAAMPSGIPVAVAETGQGWKVDWEGFVEFHADRFKRFAESRDGAPDGFRVIVRNTHYLGESFEGIERFTAYRLDPPMPDRGQYAFAETGSELQKRIASATEGGRPFTPVLKLSKRTAPDGKIYIGIDDIIATDWRPRSP